MAGERRDDAGVPRRDPTLSVVALRAFFAPRYEPRTEDVLILVNRAFNSVHTVAAALVPERPTTSGEIGRWYRLYEPIEVAAWMAPVEFLGLEFELVGGGVVVSRARPERS